MIATIADLDAAIAQENTTLTSFGAALTAVNTDIQTLIAKVQAGQQVDLTAELQAIQAHTQTIQAAHDSLVADDAAVNPPAAGAGATSGATSATASGAAAAGSSSTPPPGASTATAGTGAAGGAGAAPASAGGSSTS